jgi:hypothetical protein
MRKERIERGVTMQQTLEDFLRAKKKKEDKLKQAVDWDRRKAWWLGKINSLYDEVKQWLGPLISDGTVIIKDVTVDIDEEGIGSYEASSLEISVGSEVVKLEPIGTIIIAALGRVDLIGDDGSVMILLEQKGRSPQIRVYLEEGEVVTSKKRFKVTTYDKMETDWIVRTEKGRPKYQKLTKEVFYEALKRVMSK